MAFPSVEDTLDLLGRKMRDKITGATGVVTSVTFDLYGCVQATLHQGLDKDGKPMDQHWFDVQRLERIAAGAPKVMEPPPFGNAPAAKHDSGPASKPPPRAV